MGRIDLAAPAWAIVAVMASAADAQQLAVALPRAPAESAAEPLAPRVLDLHNAERARLGLPPLAWDPALAADAESWAQVLADSGRWEHSPPGLRPGQGENLFRGTAGAYPLDEMIGGFLDERADFHPGRFPEVANDGEWERVGHYTQIIWPQTRAVGCAVVRGGGWDYLACRYAPAGNVVGQKVP